MNVQAIDAPIEDKYVVIDAQTQKLKRWEFGDNRTFGVSGNEQAGGQGAPQVKSACIIRMFMCFMAVTSASRGFRLMHQFNFDTYIFDLDGTLISSLHDLGCKLQLCVEAERHCRNVSVEEVRTMVGNGVKLLMERAVPERNVEMTRSLSKPSRISAIIIWLHNTGRDAILIRTLWTCCKS